MFDTLFIDPKFNSNVKQLVNKPPHQFEKCDLVERIGDIKEDSIWGSLFSENEMPTVALKHRQIQKLRNDVMHSHTMSHEQYRLGRTLIKKANAEISEAIDKRTKENVQTDAGSIKSL